jgi:HSP20 family protein
MIQFQLSPLTARLWHENISHAWPDVDITENQDGYSFTLDIPGTLKEDVKIWIEDDTLTITGEKKNDPKEEMSNIVTERAFGKFERSFRLPTSVDRNKVKAELVDGVLLIFVPKTIEAKPIEISIG